MDATYPPLSVPATPEYFFSLFAAEAAFYGFTMDSPADDLAEAWDEFAWNRVAPLRRGLVTSFPGHITTADFDREFPTLKGRTVGDVCRFLADRVPRPAVRPWLNDRAAGAFLTVRHQLAAAGADVSGVRPSAPLEPYLRTHPKVFEWELQRLAPGLPFPRPDRPVERAGMIGIFAVLAVELTLLGLAKLTDDRLGVVAAGVLCLGLPLAMVVAVVGALLPPRRVTLGELVTFRDLARAMAVQQPA